MIKDKVIMVSFDNVIQNVEGNQGAFVVTGTRYQYVNGPLIAQTYPVLSTRRPMTPKVYRKVNQTDFNAGTILRTAFDNAIILGSVEE